MSSVVIAGNTSGSVTLAAPDVAGTTTLTLPATSGTVLTSASNSNFPTGSIVQVVSTTFKTLVSSSSSTYTDTGMSATITPSSASNKILVLVQCSGVGKDNNNTWAQLKVQKNNSDLFVLNNFAGYTGNSTANYFGSVSAIHLDSPASTSALTYKVQINSQANVATVYMNASNTVDTSSITLMEIRA